MIRHLGLFAAVVLLLSFPATTTLEAANTEHQHMMAAASVRLRWG